MKTENYRNLKTSEYLFITTAYAIIIDMGYTYYSNDAFVE